MKHLRLIVFALILIQTVSCRMNVRNDSVVTLLNTADSYLTAGNIHDAVDMLVSLSKGSCSVYERLGIFRRLYRLGENRTAEQCLKRGLKEHPENDEVAAVYAWFLLQENRLEDAEKMSYRLSDGAFSSLYAEIYFLNHGEDLSFTAVELIPLYLGAYQGSRDVRWLRNAAVSAALSGDMQRAASLHPGELIDAEDALFWAYCSYDSQNLLTAIQDSKLAYEFVEQVLSRAVSEMQQRDAEWLRTEVFALMADMYQLLHEDGTAENTRQMLKGSTVLENIPPAFFLNTIRYSMLQKDYEKAYRSLDALLAAHPDYGPGLALYGRFAMLQLYLLDQDDALDLMLRASGLRSLRMESLASYPQVPVEDVLSRMNKAYEKTGTPEILVESLLLQQKYIAYLAKKNEVPFTQDVNTWELLERNTLSDGSVSAPLIRYAVKRFAETGDIEDAKAIFDRHLRHHYGSDVYVDLLFDMESWECEFAAYFSVFDQQIINAIQIYEYLVYEMNEVYTGVATYTKYTPCTETLMNLAALYSCSNNVYKALEIYRSASAKTDESSLKAECLYRMALLQLQIQDLKNAVDGLEFCLSLNPSHNKARLLLQNIQLKG